MNDLMQEVYDHMFQNHTMLDFSESFPESWIDCDEGIIYLAQQEGVSLFQIKLTTQNEANYG